MLNTEQISKPMRDFSLQKCMLDATLWRIIGGPTAFERDKGAVHPTLDGQLANECLVFDIALRLSDLRDRFSEGELAPYRVFMSTIVASKTSRHVWVGTKDSESDEPMSFQQISDDADPIAWGLPMQKFLEDHLRNMSRCEPEEILVDMQVEERFMSPGAYVASRSADGKIALDRLLSMDEVTAAEKMIGEAPEETEAGRLKPEIRMSW